MPRNISTHSLICFSLSAFLFIILYLTGNCIGFTSSMWGITFWGPALYFCLINFVLKYNYEGFIYEVSTRSVLLGCIFSTGLYLTQKDGGWHVFSFYMIVMAVFHFSEFYSIAITNPHLVDVDSFILNHSFMYGAAAVASWIEWALENYFFPGMKTFYIVTYFGLAVCVAGEVLRKAAMFTAKTNFNHIVQVVKTSDHELVTHGVYALCRHPSYVGWFYWSIGTQLILLNPICVILYTLASWLFFKERVFKEEITLLEFFGNQYREYQENVGTGLPFIKGYV